MIDLSAQKWDFSKEEQAALRWLDEHGFDIKLEKQFLSKTIFTVSKGNVSDVFELTQGLKKMDVAKYMKQFQKQWDMYCELKQLQAI